MKKIQLTQPQRDPPSWRLYNYAQSLLLTTLCYRFALASTLPATPPTGPLTNFLLEFETRFSSRRDVSLSGWLAAFHSLCLFSITKTLLSDTPTPTPHQSMVATVHKILVSIFTWSAKISAWCPQELCDPLAMDWSHGSNDDALHIRDALQATRSLVHRNRPEKNCIRRTRDFLLQLGTGIGFLGYVVEKEFAALPPVERRMDGCKEILELPSAASRVTSPTSSSVSREKSDREGGAAPPGLEGSGFGNENWSIVTFAGSSIEVGPSRGETANAAHRPGRKRELSSQQRGHAAAIRKLGACRQCKARKVMCSSKHPREDPRQTSPRTQWGN